jgi:hypothetical protein
VAAAAAHAAAARAPWQAVLDDINGTFAELQTCRARLPALIDVDDFEQAVEGEALQRRIAFLERRLARLNAAIAEDGELFHLRVDSSSATWNLQAARSSEGRARAQLGELLAQLGPVLAALYYYSGDPADLALTIEVRP